MTKDEWIKRCAEQFVKVGGVEQEQANEMATSINEDPDWMDTFDDAPEAAADEEMSYWDFDEDENNEVVS